jgi:plasmid stabilization system protein ParE
VKPPIFRPAAAADVEDAYRWYEAQRAGLGDEFLVVVSTVVESLVEYPERFPVVYRETRRVHMRRFPYSLYYRIRLLWSPACMEGGTPGGGNLVVNG